MIRASRRRRRISSRVAPSGISNPDQRFHWNWRPWQFTATRDDRTVVLPDNLPKGVHEFTYYAWATTPGEFFVAPAQAEETYFPETFGRSDSGRFPGVP